MKPVNRIANTFEPARLRRFVASCAQQCCGTHPHDGKDFHFHD